MRGYFPVLTMSKTSYEYQLQYKSETGNVRAAVYLQEHALLWQSPSSVSRTEWPKPAGFRSF